MALLEIGNYIYDIYIYHHIISVASGLCTSSARVVVMAA